ncbi:MAG: bifunctional 4-hydroxy-2-oxoglutarate aldolase/2-dehydro-3-deoxy-phosphogluconate aldolase [Planctomycetes bacterium]|nr:bifunctional 4-hydroxy-2-oxoglutarate aldolase/2-dehydro-3-deoxy-phosphogluconate aldolase [Planctomycetota bacterium]
MPPTRAAVLNAFAQHRCSAILRTSDRDVVRPALEAAIAGGLRIVEVTLTTPDALEHIAALSERHGLLVGAGTVLSVDMAKEAMAAGARFLVSPVVDPAVITFCRQHDLVSVPGTLTPTEMMTAHRAGADLVKLFPGPANGPDFVRAVRGPLPFLRIFPTSGVTEDNIDAWLQAGAFGLGFVASLFDADDLKLRRFDAITQRAARMVAKVKAHGPASLH